MRWNRSLATLSLLATVGGTQAVEPEDLFSYSLEELMQVRVTSSTMSEHSLRTVPSSVSVFDRQQIDKLGMDYLHELINLVPGFQSFRQEDAGDEYYHSSRGHRSSTSSREVLIRINGQRFNREFDNAIAVPMIPLAMIEKVEFIRGPGSALYGSNAFLGVIDITLKQDQNELLSSAGENGHLQSHLIANAKAGDVDWHAMVGGLRDSGESAPLELQNGAGFENSEDPHRGVDLNLGAAFRDTSVEVLHFKRRSEDFYLLGEVADGENETGNTFTSAQLAQRHAWSPTLSSDYSLRHFQESYEGEGTQPFLGLTSFEQQSRGIEAQLWNRWQATNDHQLLFGFEYRKIDLRETALDSQFLGGDILYPESTREVFGAYVQGEWQVTRDTAVTAGARLDDYSSIGSAFSPRLGLTHQLTVEDSLKLLYGEAFRAPTTNETDIRDVYGAGILEGNPDLEPERIRTVELVWLRDWSAAQSALSLFDNGIRDAIVRDNSAIPATFENSSDEQHAQGLEGELTATLTPQLQIRGSYTHLYNQERSDVRQADHFGAMIVDYARSRWNGNVSVTYAGPRTSFAGTDEVTLDEVWQLNSRLQFSPRDNIAVYLQVKNLLDESYETPYERSTFTEGVPNREREISVGARLRFD